MNKVAKFKSNFKAGSVDRENNIIHGMSLIQANREALGHELFIDEKFVRSVVKQGKETGDIGLKARFDHPSSCFSSMGTQIGRFKNFKMSGDKAVADLHLAPFAFESNPNGNLGEFLMDAAENDPDIMGNSIVFGMAEPEMFKAKEGENEDSPEFIYPHARLSKLYGCDVVDEGAATDGMFSIKGRPNYLAEQAEHFLKEKEDLIRTVLKPLINEMVTDLNNKNKSKMSDEKKSFFDKLTDLMSKEKEVSPDKKPVELGEGEKEAATIALASKNTEIEALKATIEAGETELTAVKDELTTAKEGFNTSLAEIKTDFEAFKKESIGSLIEDGASDGTSVDLSEEAVEIRRLKEKDSNISKWIGEGFPKQ
tara:strand:- start:1658 stop:2761 length:1104 start_codon:yes stop_codon:yes gene_type:complete